jgi:nitrilase
MKFVKAAAVQISPVLYSRDRTIETVMRKIHALGEQIPLCHVSRFQRKFFP